MTNHLAHETSPYLLQHANNPVDWYPWNEKALQLAREQNKPILLSIGYAACHWCHVMAHESFEDKETAELMNELFINIKVDREERPDLDKIYQTAHYLLTQSSGGWPLTVFLTPDDLTPFFTGTYFPRESRHQLPAFKDVLITIANIYQQQLEAVKKQNAELIKILNQTSLAPTGVQLNTQPVTLALQLLTENFDSKYGGFFGAPKFPQAPMLEFLLSANSPMLTTTLDRMATGGLFDHLSGGFFRYSVDVAWQIPHFEKMLYDNALLLGLYARTGNTDVTNQVANWVINEMQSATGGYYSSIDADSEGQEGKYYVWDKAEIKSILDPDEYEVTKTYFGLDEAANFEDKWHLHVVNQVADNQASLLERAKAKLLARRKERIAPARDEKILTSWNALMIKNMLIAGDVLQDRTYINSAERALAFIYKTMWQDKRLLATYKDGKAHLPAYLDDYVFLLDALLTSLQITWNKKYLHFAIELADSLLQYFYDANNGGFYFTANDHEKLLYRPKTLYDEAIPSGNAIAVQALLLLGHLLGNKQYLDAAEKTLQLAWPKLTMQSVQFSSFLLGLQEFLHPEPIIILRGSIPDMQNWRKQLISKKNKVFSIPSDEKDLPDALAVKKPQDKLCAYVCTGLQCSEVIYDLSTLKPTE